MEHLEVFHRVIREGSFSLLESYEERAVWKKMSEEERDLLGMLFVWRGDAQLRRGSREMAERSFELSVSVAPHSPDVFYWCGISWLKHKEFHIAAEKFEEALQLSENFGLAWKGWGIALSRLGEFVAAEEKFQFAKGCIEESESRAELYWEWGKLYFMQGTHSEEAVDFHSALEHFSIAEREGIDEYRFWLDYGKAFASLGNLIRDDSFLNQALAYISRAVEKNRDSYEGWLGLGHAFKGLFEISSNEDHYLRAHDCFERAYRLEEDDGVLLEWAELLVLEGERRASASCLEEALEKLKKLNKDRLEEPDVVALAIKAMLRLALLLERLDILKDAEQQARRGVIAYPTSGLLWCRFGDCFYSQGVYFSDPDLFRDAADKYAYALTLESSLSAAHIGLAQASFGVGSLRGDPSYLEKAAQRCGLVASRDKLSANGWHLWGLSLLRLAEYHYDREKAEDALYKLGRALTLRGGIENSAEIEWLIDYGSALDLLASLSEDESYARQALQIFSRLHYLQPDDLEIRFRLGIAWLHLGESAGDPDCLRRAMDNFEAVAIRDPDDEVVWDEWGCALLNLSRLIADPANPQTEVRLLSEAEEKFKRAACLGCSEALYHLAWLNAQANREEEATNFLRQAARQGGLPSIESLLYEDWLNPIRESDLFLSFLREANDELDD